jgi:Tfp pilus assembly protein PilF
MPSKPEIADTEIQNAFNELRCGNKQAARSWALHTISQTPEMEDPWLILAAIAEPGASLHYLKEAFKINPDSERARQGLSDLQKRLEKISLTTA